LLLLAKHVFGAIYWKRRVVLLLEIELRKVIMDTALID